MDKFECESFYCGYCSCYDKMDAEIARLKAELESLNVLYNSHSCMARAEAAERERDQLRRELGEMRGALEEFRRCVDTEKLPEDHSDEDECCFGVCMWIGAKAKELLTPKQGEPNAGDGGKNE